MKKITVVGAGSAGCFTALFNSVYFNNPDVEVELIHDPEIKPESVGQATLLEPPSLLASGIGFDWYNNNIHATPKTGISYEGWGKKNDKFFHPFPPNTLAMHLCPWEMQEAVLGSGNFKVVEGKVDPKDVDSDFVFDCRGKPDDLSDYDELVNPLNAVILGKPNWNTTENLWSRHVATPDGWTFVIPTNINSPSRSGSVGYLYNDTITSKEDAEKNFLEMFDVEITNNLKFKNYVAKNPIIDDRIFLNGNRLFFLEPLESTAIQSYIEFARLVYNFICIKIWPSPNAPVLNTKDINARFKQFMSEVEHFVLWHYQYGSKYDTPFWDYAKTLPFESKEFDQYLEISRNRPNKYGEGDTGHYGVWSEYSLKNWYDGMNSNITYI